MATHIKTLAVCALLAVVGVGGCGDQWDLPEFDVPVRDGSPVQTDYITYTLHAELDNFVEGAIAAQARYTNSTAESVYFGRCLPSSAGPMFGVDRAAPDAGSSVVGLVWACVGGVEPGVVEPGTTLEFTVPLGSSVMGGEPPITMRQRTGLFRISLELFRSRSAALRHALLPIAERRSNVFEINPPD